VKGPSETPSSRKREADRRTHRAVPDVAPPPLGTPGVTLGSDTEILQKLVRQLRLERAFLQAVLEQMPVGVAIAEAPSGRLVLGNTRMETILREEFFSAQTVDQYDHWKASRPNGQPVGAREHPMARAILFGDIVRGELMRLRRQDGTDVLLEVSAAPVRDEKGLIVAGVTSFQDVSDRPWAQAWFGGGKKPGKRR
jgi:PAS domain-containing protein